MAIYAFSMKDTRPYHAHSGPMEIKRQWLCFSPTTKKPLLSKLLVVRCNAKRVGRWCVGQPEELRNEDQITRENPLDASIAFGRSRPRTGNRDRRSLEEVFAPDN